MPLSSFVGEDKHVINKINHYNVLGQVFQNRYSKRQKETLRKMPQIFQNTGKGENFGDVNKDTVGGDWPWEGLHEK